MSDGDLIRLPEEKVPGKPLGRFQWHDPRNRGYSVKPILETVDRTRVRPWWGRPIFDQQGSSCTAQAAVGCMVSVPFRKNKTIRAALKDYDSEEERHALYLEAQKHDPWAGGEPQYEGSSTDAPFKVLRDRGVITGWRWVFTFQDFLDTIRYVGPVSMGTWWPTGMDEPDKQNRIHYSGDKRGGHAFDAEYVDDDDKHIVIPNSWGKGYGRKGRVYLPFADAEAALADGGEACCIVL